MDCAELLTRISQSNPPLAVCIRGNDAYWCRRALDSLTNLADAFDVCIASDNIGLRELVCELGTVPMLGNYRVIIVRSFAKPNQKDKSLFIDYLKAPNPSSILIFECECDFDNVEKVVCDKLSGYRLRDEIKKIVDDNGKTICNEVIDKLVEYCESDMSRINTECKKLCAFVDNEITLRDVEECVEPDITYKTYNFVNYMVAGDYVSCYDFLKKNSDKGLIVLATIIKMYRFAFYCKGYDFNRLSKIFDMKYSANVGRQISNKYSASDLYYLLKLCYKLEFEIKSGETMEEQALTYIISEAIERRIK